MADWEKIIGTFSNVVKAGSQVYATTVIAQAQVGLFDTQTKSLNTQISLLKDTALTQKETTENVKKANQIKNKIMYKEYITQDEYDFLVSLGYDIGLSYLQYIDYISNDNTQNTITEQVVEEPKQINIKPYLFVIFGLAGAYLIFRGRK